MRESKFDALPTPWGIQMWVPNKKTMEEQGVGACSLARNTLEGYRGVFELWDGTRKNWQASLTHTGLHKTNTRSLVHSWSTFDVRTSHGQLGLIRLITAWTWGKPPSSPYSIFYASPRGSHPNGILSWDSQVGVSKSPKLGLPRFWGPITSRVDLGLRWGLKQSYSPRQELSNGMLHATWT